MQHAEASDKQSIDERNKAFWNDLCGSQLARQLGVTDSSPASLKKFDDWYFDFYPYLNRHIPFNGVRGKKVLEVGLGYGTVAQRLVESGADYTGLDVSEGPVAMVNNRLSQMHLPGEAVQGSVLECPFPDESFDSVVAIGCYHHTGNLQSALEQTWRVLKPSGQAMVMVYNAYSYRRLLQDFEVTFRYWLWDWMGTGTPPEISERERARYDVGSDGGAAPETVFTSRTFFPRLSSPL